MGRSFKFISINKICASLGEQKSRSLPVFHAFCGCDTTSAFNGKGKRSAWKVWELCSNAVTPTLEFLSVNPLQELKEDSIHFRKLERLVIIMYDKSRPMDSVNEARMDRFCKHSRALENLPPTQVKLRN